MESDLPDQNKLLILEGKNIVIFQKKIQILIYPSSNMMLWKYIYITIIKHKWIIEIIKYCLNEKIRITVKTQ